MIISFYSKRKPVYTVVTDDKKGAMRTALDLVNKQEIQWDLVKTER